MTSCQKPNKRSSSLQVVPRSVRLPGLGLVLEQKQPDGPRVEHPDPVSVSERARGPGDPEAHDRVRTVHRVRARPARDHGARRSLRLPRPPLGALGRRTDARLPPQCQRVLREDKPVQLVWSSQVRITVCGPADTGHRARVQTR